MFAQSAVKAAGAALPVEEDPLTDRGYGLLRLIQGRQLRLQAVFGERHACEDSRVDEKRKQLASVQICCHASSGLKSFTPAVQ